ncbi:hypothetical protein [Ktedonobacter robiniae]|uniref:Nmad3 family putative nucleotide modification protein n=1 Tax=Ktedonobacter robiniae TaxID=2778365 RepID=UPI001914F38D|nr:hypothetical protein [Ktedonobacter robiniae]
MSWLVPSPFKLIFRRPRDYSTGSLVTYASGKYRYVSTAPDLHVIFGWLQIEQHLASNDFATIPLWARDHPHCKADTYRNLDFMYLSPNRLHIPGVEIEKAGAGWFPHFMPELCLTAPNQTRSVWQLPAWFAPGTSTVGFSYHRDLARWKRDGCSIFLRTVGRGQEFVLDTEAYPEALQWLCQLLRMNLTIP